MIMLLVLFIRVMLLEIVTVLAIEIEDQLDQSNVTNEVDDDGGGDSGDGDGVQDKKNEFDDGHMMMTMNITIFWCCSCGGGRLLSIITRMLVVAMATTIRAYLMASGNESCNFSGLWRDAQISL